MSEVEFDEVGYAGWVSFEDFSTAQPLEDRTRDNLAYAKRVLDTPARSMN